MKSIISFSANTSWYIYNFRRSLMKRLQEKGADVFVIAPEDDYSYKLQNEGYGFIPLRIDNRSTNPLREVRVIKDYRRIYASIMPDIALHYTPKPNLYGSLAAQMLGIPTINNIAGLGTAFIKRGFLSMIVSRLYSLSQRRAFQVFFQNPDDLDLFVSSRLVPQDKAALLPGSGVNIQKFKPFRIKHNINSALCFLLIARLIWDKGIGEFAEAARILKRKYPEVQFKLLGFVDYNNPSVVPEIQIRAWEAEGILSWLGRTDDVRPFIAESTCIVLPSYYREGTPKSLLEAASMAKPLITTDSIGCRQAVDDGVSGFLCQPRSAEDLAEKMERIILMPDYKIEEMGQQGRAKMVRDFDEKIVIEAYINAIEVALRDLDENKLPI